MNRKHKKVCLTQHYIEHYFILASTITGYISISTFASWLGIPLGNTSSAIGLKTCVINAGIKQYKKQKSIIKKRRKSHDKTVLVAKSKLNTLTSKNFGL